MALPSTLAPLVIPLSRTVRGQHLRQVENSCFGTEMADLGAAGEAVGHDDGSLGALANGRQQRALGYGPRHFVPVSVVSEGSGHPAASCVEHLKIEAMDPLQQASFTLQSGDCLVVAVSMDERPSGEA